MVWLDDDASSLAELLNSINPNSQLKTDQLPEFVFVDDLYSPKGQNDLQLDVIRRLVADAPEHPWPTIVTCGPPEFLSQFQHSGSSEFLRIQDWTLPPVRKEEKSQFQHWFTDRTGEAPKTGEAFQQTDGLMVSMAFEVKHGDLGAFAGRFRDRLKNSELDESLCIPLAVNRLYVLAPSDWLEEPEWERLDELNQDSDFSVLDIQSHGKYLRLTHPHLSDSIYRSVRNPSSARAFANDLADALLRAQKDSFTHRQIMRTLASGHERLEALDMAHLVDRFARDWNSGEFLVKGDARSDILVSVACWDARNSEFGLAEKLQTPLLEKARRALDDAPTIWPHLWQRLYKTYPNDRELKDDAKQWMTTAAAQEHAAFSRVWEDLWEAAQVENSALLEEMSKVGFDWINSHCHANDWHFVWKRLLSCQNNFEYATTSKLLQAGRNQLQDVKLKQGLVWPFIWNDLAAANFDGIPFQRDELLHLGYDWLSGREDHDSWSFIWRKLLEESALPEGIGREELLRLGYDWLSGREDHDSWYYIWAKLLEESALPEGIDREALLRLGYDWLSGREDHDSWPFILLKLLEEPALPEGIDREALLRLGYDWLSGREDHDSWPFILLKLLEEPALPEGIDREALLRLGYDWLSGREDHDSWYYIWAKLLEESALPEGIDREELLRLGYDWLSGREDHDSWYYIWAKLLEESALPDGIDRQELLRLGYDWLSGREDHDSWYYIWAKLLEESALPEGIDREELLRLGYGWLSGRERHDSWTFIWQNLFDQPVLPEGIDRDDLNERGASWLLQKEHIARGEWDKLFEMLIDSGFTDEKLLAAGATWARDNLNQPQTPPLIAKILRHTSQTASVDDLAEHLVKVVTDNPEKGSTRFCYGYLKAELDLTGKDNLPNGWAKLAEWLKSGKPKIDPEKIEAVRKIIADDQLVTGTISKRLSGGFVVALSGLEVNAFLPGSHVDIEKPTDWDAYVGRELDFQLLNVDEDRGQIIVSRKNAILKNELAQLAIDQRVTAVLSNIVDYGVFLSFGRISGLLHSKNYSWNATDWPPTDLVAGDALEVVIARIDHENAKVEFSRKELLDSPWSGIEDRLAPGKIVVGTVQNLANYGAFVEVEPGVQGLLHVNELSWTKKISHPSELLENDAKIECVVLAVDAGRQRLSLGVKQLIENPWLTRIPETYTAGTILTGRVTNKTSFGAFIEIENELEGLLHLSEIADDPPETLDGIIKVGEMLRVRVLNINVEERKIALSLRGVDQSA